MKGLLSCFVLILLSSPTFQEGLLKGAPVVPSEVQFLGSADGKSFFFEKSSTRTWEEAGEFCESTGMHLASFETSEQLSVITNSTNGDFYGDCYWTSARDSTHYSHFTWNDTETTVVLLDNNYVFFAPYRTCIYFCRAATNLFEAYKCDSDVYTLCETT